MNKKAVILILSLAVFAADPSRGAKLTVQGTTKAPVSTEVMWDLSSVGSRQYIYDQGGVRARVKQSGLQVRLNLGDDFEKYMVNTEFRDHVNALVKDPLKQIWSDVLTLDLSGSQVEDISPLAGLVNLKKLNLFRCRVKDIGPLAGLTNLEGLSLAKTQVENISAIAKLIILQRLFLHHTQVEDITALSELENLSFLELSGTQVRTLNPLVKLTNLKQLRLSSSMPVDITVLGGRKSLQIYIDGLKQAFPESVEPTTIPITTTAITSTLKPETCITSVVDAFFDLNSDDSRRFIDDESFRDGVSLGRRVRLNLSGSDFRDYVIDEDLRAAIDNLVENPIEQIWSDVKDFDLSDTQVQDIAPLARLKNLQSLLISYAKLQDLSPLAGLLKLHLLKLSHTQVRDISPLARLVKLQWLELSSSQVKDIRPLEGLVNLRKLYLSHTQVKDISPLKGLVNLEYLYLAHTQVKDISQLAGLMNLQRFSLSHIQVANISSLAKMKRLEYLNLSSTQVQDVTPLVGLESLKDLHLSSCMPITYEDILALRGLKSLRIWIGRNMFSFYETATTTPLNPAKSITTTRHPAKV